MLFLVSGEGPSDMGVCSDGNAVCTVPDFQVGPMAVIVELVVQKRHFYVTVHRVSSL
ncbi:MAG: hypothetical protein J5I93_11995 [Pirellulaceae bacterium]|nr:hypothetical protein [Pirellulaceae bacterium]